MSSLVKLHDWSGRGLRSRNQSWRTAAARLGNFWTILVQFNSSVVKLERSQQWPILSKAFDKSRRTTSVNFFESIASSTLSVVITLCVSLMSAVFYCHFGVQWGACCCSYIVIWFKATRSCIEDAKGRSKTGRLLLTINLTVPFF